MISPLIKLRKKLSKKGFHAMLVSSPSDIFYLTNYPGLIKEEREIFLFITKNYQYVLTDRRYIGTVKALILNYKLVEISSKHSLTNALNALRTKHKIKKLGIDESDIKVSEYKKLKKRFNKICHCNSISDLRTTKEREEISRIEKACQLGDKTFNYILKKIRLGISEKEIVFEIELFTKQHGADISFPPVIAFGPNSAIPHHRPTNKKLKKNQIILLDFGVKLNNYCSDMTRTIFFGKSIGKFKKMYNAVLKAQKRAMEHISRYHAEFASASSGSRSRNKFGMTASKVDGIARDYIVSQGYETIPHSLGHGIGIDVHENPHLSPKSKDSLTEGMVFSVEPGIYVPDFGGIRIEDLIVLEKSGPRLLTHSPKTIIEL